MRKAALIYNPTSGSKRQDRLRPIAAATEVLRAGGVEVIPVETLGPATAGAQAREAVLSGCDCVVACGGDGTIHDVLQGVVATDAALGILPMGTANALACDLGLPLEPRKAAAALLTAEPRRIAAGKIEYADRNGQPQSRFFTVAAGIGADAHLAYELSAEFKRRHGMAAYYAKATQLLMTHKFPPFEVHLYDKTAGRQRTESVTELLAIRITDFGGVLRRMAPRAALCRDDLELVLFKSGSRFSYLQFILGNMMGRASRSADIEFVAADSVECSLPEAKPGTAAKIHAEADGEDLGVLPVRISIVPRVFTLLTPQPHRSL